MLNHEVDALQKVCVIRPHNVYGTAMGREHVIPQLTLRMLGLMNEQTSRKIALPIQGTGNETRSNVHVNDFVDGLVAVMKHGTDRQIYHVGNPERTSTAALANLIAATLHCSVELIPGELAKGSPIHRSPDISKARSLGFEPKIPLEIGLPPVVEWYVNNTPS